MTPKLVRRCTLLLLLLASASVMLAVISGADVSSVRRDDAGRVLSDTILRYMSDLDIDNGLLAVGYSTDDIPVLVKATLPQERVRKLSPRPHTEEDLASLLEQSMTVY